MKTREIVIIGLLGALAFLLMATFSIPILPHAQYLRFEPGEVPGLLAVYLLGPVAGVLVNGIKGTIYFLFRATSIFGPISDFLASGSFAIILGWIYRSCKGKGAFVYALLFANIGRVLIMIPVNIIILGLQFGMDKGKVMSLMLPAIIPFNIIKSTLNSIFAHIIIKVLIRRRPNILSLIKGGD